MAARPGEENVATLFGDIHYFYSGAEVKPRHHRFDKGSYVYLFENASERRCRVQIANNPGAEDQDAFDGFLDQTQVRYSYKHHCMVTLSVAEEVNQTEWHLPTYDPRNENKYHYKLHSLDIYFWKQQDALLFVNGVRRVLPPSQVEVLDEPGPPPLALGMSRIVQKLENAAIAESMGDKPSPPAQSTSTGPSTTTTAPPAAPTNFAPMAYNPAAPAAPETIRHREKTPPPDEDPLNPLAVAVAFDYQKQPFTPGYPPQAQFPPSLQSPGLPPSLGGPGGPPSQFGGPPQNIGINRAATVPIAMPSPGPSSAFGSGFPNTQGGGLPPPPPSQSVPQTQPAQPTPPPGGFSTYNYGLPNNQSRPAGSDFSVHQQVYRPTESEALGAQFPQGQGREPRGKLEENAGRLERGMTGMFKKFEKKFG